MAEHSGRLRNTRGRGTNLTTPSSRPPTVGDASPVDRPHGFAPKAILTVEEAPLSVTYRLAEFFKFVPAEDLFGAPPLPNPPAESSYPAAASPEERRFLADLRLMERFSHRRQPQTDLLEVLPEHDRDRGWLEQTLAILRNLRDRQANLTLLECDRDVSARDTTTVVATLATHMREVRRGDEVCAGFTVIRASDSAPHVLPRIYRPICTNGAVAFSHDGAACTQGGSLAEQVDAVLDPRVFEPSIARLQRAAATPIRDLAAFVARARLRTPLPELLAALRDEHDDSLWGLINAATAAARRERDWRRRLDREQDAERILAALETEPRRVLVERKAIPVAVG